MTKTTRKTISAILAVLLTAVFAVSAFVVSMAEDASISHAFEMAQVVEGTSKPESVSANYAIVPDKPEYPLPVDKEGKAMDVFTLAGTSLKEGTFTFTEPGTYQYTAGKLKDDAKAPYSASSFEEGTKTKPLKHIFGYKVERNTDGTLSIIAYTCEDPTIKLHSDGNGMTVYNYLQVKEPSEPSEPDEPTPVEPVTNNNNQPVTNKNNTIRTTIVTRYTPTTVVNHVNTVRGGRVNTGDPAQLALWVGILAAAAIGLILLFIAKRRKDDEENQ